VFRRGTWVALKGVTPRGGQSIPISAEGANLEWKKAQKNETNNIISEEIKRIIPHRNPDTTNKVCSPCRVLSRVMSRHHWYVTIVVAKNPNVINPPPLELNHLVSPVAKMNEAKATIIGHGLWSTRWNECFFFN